MHHRRQQPGCRPRRIAAPTQPPLITPRMSWPSAPMFQTFGPEADRQPDADQHQRRRLDQQFADAIEIRDRRGHERGQRTATDRVRRPRTRSRAQPAGQRQRDHRRKLHHQRPMAARARSSLNGMGASVLLDRLRPAPMSRRSLRCRSRRGWCRAGACAASAGRRRSRRCGRRSRTARRVLRRSPGWRRRRSRDRAAPGGWRSRRRHRRPRSAARRSERRAAAGSRGR